ncbi:Uu.00g100430.m01.CDS01 [Anthostomella pinea]|uniref:Uu.00g100430.m01.CDS01 n=1 Tax=Anthostomella pinea TaxID=933095 RepID=A0AAI8VD28_9PEZI|nr:Uu.00g100430.m01.CDS01 [Anthostomella pinea]
MLSAAKLAIFLIAIIPALSFGLHYPAATSGWTRHYRDEPHRTLIGRGGKIRTRDSLRIDGIVVDDLKFLGKGDFGSVYRGNVQGKTTGGKDMPTEVAIKECRGAQHVKSCEKEIRAISELHERVKDINIPKIFASQHTEELDRGKLVPVLRFIMTLGKGGTLADSMETYVKIETNKNRLRATKELWKTLSKVHGAGWADGDIKSRNLVFEEEWVDRKEGPPGQILIVDFGMAQSLSDKKAHYEVVRKRDLVQMAKVSYRMFYGVSLAQTPRERTRLDSSRSIEEIQESFSKSMGGKKMKTKAVKFFAYVFQEKIPDIGDILKRLEDLEADDLEY